MALQIHLTFVAAGHISCVPILSQVFMCELAINLDALVCATRPGSGSRKIRIVMACRRSRVIICSPSPVCLASSSNEMLDPSGTKFAIPCREMAWRHTELLL